MVYKKKLIKKNGKTYKLVEIVDEVDERIEFFKKWSDTKYCLEAVKGNGYYLRYVKDQTEAICLEAVKGNGYYLRYVKDQTEAICLEAVKGNGDVLQYVKDQTEAICLEAVKGNGDVLQYVKDVKIFEKIIGGKIKC